jgi:hypothetical protein
MSITADRATKRAINSEQRPAPLSAEALEAQRLERTRPKPPMETKRFARWCMSNPLRPKETLRRPL